MEWDLEIKLYVGIVPGIPGAHTQAAIWDELQRNLRRDQTNWKGKWGVLP